MSRGGKRQHGWQKTKNQPLLLQTRIGAAPARTGAQMLERRDQDQLRREAGLLDRKDRCDSGFYRLPVRHDQLGEQPPGLFRQPLETADNADDFDLWLAPEKVTDQLRQSRRAEHQNSNFSFVQFSLGSLRRPGLNAHRRPWSRGPKLFFWKLTK